MLFYISLTVMSIGFIVLCNLLAIIGLTVFAVKELIAFGHNGQRPRIVLFFTLLFLLILVGRWTSILVPYPLNPDESQMIAQAITFASKPIPWIHVDSASSGPLNSYFLMYSYVFGVTPNYVTSRIAVVIILFVSLLVVYIGMARFVKTTIALWSVLIGGLFYSVCRTNDLLHYSSELLSVLLLSVGFTLVSSILVGKKKQLYIGIIVLSMVPFAKLQAGVIAVSIVIIVVCLDLKLKRFNVEVKYVLSVLLSGLIFPLFVFVVLYVFDGLYDFKKSYLDFAFGYGNVSDMISVFKRILMIESVLGEAKAVFLMSILLSLGYLLSSVLVRIRYLRSDIDNSAFSSLGMLIIVYFGASVFAIIKPGTGFGHYWHYIVIPFVWLVGYSSVFLRNYSIKGGVECVILCAMFSVFGLGFLTVPTRFVCDLILIENFRQREVVSIINTIKSPGDEITVWGWDAGVHVETGLAAGTRDVVTVHAVPDSELAFPIIGLNKDQKKYYQDRFMRDFEHSMPAFFMDACAPGSFLLNSRTFGVERFSALWNLLNEYYSQVYGPGSQDQEGVRLWVRNDKVDELVNSSVD